VSFQNIRDYIFHTFCWNLSLLDFAAALITCSTTPDFTNVSDQDEKGRENKNCCELMSRVTHVSQPVMKQPMFFFKPLQRALKSGIFFDLRQATAKNRNTTAGLET